MLKLDTSTVYFFFISFHFYFILFVYFCVCLLGHSFRIYLFGLSLVQLKIYFRPGPVLQNLKKLLANVMLKFCLEI